MRTRAAGKLVGILVPCLALGAVLLQQYGVFGREMRVAEEHLSAARVALTQVKAAVPRLAQVDAELTGQGRDLERLALIMPHTFDTAAIVRGLNEVAARFGVEVQENGYREKPGDAPLTGEISVTVFGPSDAIDRFTAQIHRLSRLQGWQEDYRFKGGVLGTVTTWYWPPESPPVRPECRAVSRTGVWLPPLRARLAATLDELSALCEQLDANREVVGRIDRFESNKDRIEDLVETVNRLKTQIDSDWPPKEKGTP